MTETTTGTTEYIIPQRILSAHLEKPFNAKYNTLDYLNIGDAQEFRRRHATVIEQVRRLENAAVVRVVFKWRKSIERSEQPALYKRVPSIARVLGRRVSNHCIRTWHARAATVLIYNWFVVPSSQFARLQDAPLSQLVAWASEMKREFQALIDAKQADECDLMMAFSRAALAKHRHENVCIAVHKPKVGDERQFALVMPSMPMDNLDGAKLDEYSDECCNELAFFVSKMQNKADRSNLALDNIHQMWFLYLYSIHQRRGDERQENPYLSHLKQQQLIVEQFSDLYNAVLRLHANTVALTARWRNSKAFPCSIELESIWLNRIDCLRRGLECGFFMHRIVRQDIMRQVVAAAQQKFGPETFSLKQRRLPKHQSEAEGMLRSTTHVK